MDIFQIIIDIFLLVYICVFLYGLKNQRIYGLGQWFLLSDSKSKYWQTVIGYLILIVTLLVLRQKL